jgi:drug/metabolite transporter (DMT)-like permease
VHQRPIFALVLRLGSALSFATMALLIKFAGEASISLPQIMLWRQIVPVFALLGWLAATGSLHLLKTNRLGSHATRSLVGMAGMACNFGSLLLLPLAEATTLSFTAPLFAVALGHLVFGERAGPWRLTAIALGFAGVVVMAQPGGTPVSPLGVAAALGSALAVAGISYQIREMARTESSVSIVFYFSAFGSLVAAMALPFTGFQTHTAYEWALLVAIGLMGTLGQLLVTASLRHGALVSLIVLDYTMLIWATLYGWLAWDQFPHAATWVGAPLIVAAGVVIAWREHRLARERSPTSAST